MDDIDIDHLILSLQDRVAERRSTGDYPVGLEEELEAEFTIIMAAVHRDEVDTRELGRRVTAVEQSTAAIRSTGRTTSRVPGGSAMHHVAARLIGRHTSAVAESVHAVGIDVARAFHEVQHMIDVQREADERQLRDVLSSVMDRLAVIDQLSAAIVHLEGRVRALEASATSEQ